MSFDDPMRLWLLAVVGVLLVGYVAVQSRRGTYALRFSDASLLDNVAPRRPGWRRHLVAALFLTAAGLMVVAFAGPFTEEVPQRATIVLTSTRRCRWAPTTSIRPASTRPNRRPTTSSTMFPIRSTWACCRSTSSRSCRSPRPATATPWARRSTHSQLGPFTATGDAIAASVQVVQDTGRPTRDAAGEPTAVVVLLSDGEPTVGRTIDEAIVDAQEADVAITTVALGTPLGVVDIEDPANPGVIQTEPVPVDEITLETVALATGGEFYSLDSFSDLAEVYRDIGTALGEDPVRNDASDWFVGMALATVALTGMLSLLWFQRLP